MSWVYDPFIYEDFPDQANIVGACFQKNLQLFPIGVDEKKTFAGLDHLMNY